MRLFYKEMLYQVSFTFSFTHQSAILQLYFFAHVKHIVPLSLSICLQAASANVLGLNPASHLLLSLRDQDNLTRNSSLSSMPKVSRRFSPSYYGFVIDSV